MMTDGMYTSKTPEWSTPQKFFDELDRQYHFTLDPCATKENAKCKNYFTIKDDGLSKPWVGRIFMNPPYGRGISAWVKKAFESGGNGTTVVCLLPARTDTSWFHEYCYRPEAQIKFIRGRLKFGEGKNPAPFPSMLVIFS